MAYIYQIKNKINEKIYIGKTEFSIEKRFKEHCKDAFRREEEKRPLYIAMRKYGIENFEISLIEETNNPEEREIFWIEYLGSFKYGYNATIGGDGRKYIDYDLVIATYKELQNASETAKKLNISFYSVINILKLKQINILKGSEVVRNKIGKKVNQYDLNDNFIQCFPSLQSAAKNLGKITKTSNSATGHISEVCRGIRKTAYGYKWKYAEE